MTRNITLLLVTVLGLTAAVSLLFFKNQSPTQTSSKVMDGIKQVIASKVPFAAPAQNSNAPKLETHAPVKPWDSYAPLTEVEKKEFELADIQVQKYLTWGKMDQDAVSDFRQTLFKMGDRAVADLARSLSRVGKDDIKDKADAEAIVHKIDTLAYFANSSFPLASDCIAELAQRPVFWNESGELLNPIEANITFEMFDIHARYHPVEAASFITNIDKNHRTAYFTHYAYGRKLAGKTLDEIDLELKKIFGSPEIALK